MNDLGNHWAMWVFGGDHADLLYGGPGEDALCGRPGNDLMYGEDGHDELEGHNGNDIIKGGPGNDRIEGWGDTDWIYGGPGDDLLLGGIPQSVPPDTPDAGDHIYGGDGNDRIDGYIGADTLYGDGQNDHAGSPETEPGNDEIYGHDGYDIIEGGAGHDDLFGEDDSASIIPGAGDDVVDGEPATQYPQVDLVANMDELGDFDASYGSDDNREENGFFGGKKLHDDDVRYKVEIYVHHYGMDLTGYGLLLENSDPTAVEIWTEETGGQMISTPAPWTIGADVPEEVYLRGVALGGTALTLTVLDPNNNNEPVVDRPLPDYMMVIVAGV